MRSTDNLVRDIGRLFKLREQSEGKIWHNALLPIYIRKLTQLDGEVYKVEFSTSLELPDNLHHIAKALMEHQSEYKPTIRTAVVVIPFAYPKKPVNLVKWGDEVVDKAILEPPMLYHQTTTSTLPAAFNRQANPFLVPRDPRNAYREYDLSRESKRVGELLKMAEVPKVVLDKYEQAIDLDELKGKTLIDLSSGSNAADSTADTEQHDITVMAHSLSKGKSRRRSSSPPVRIKRSNSSERTQAVLRQKISFDVAALLDQTRQRIVKRSDNNIPPSQDMITLLEARSQSTQERESVFNALIDKEMDTLPKLDPSKYPWPLTVKYGSPKQMFRLIEKQRGFTTSKVLEGKVDMLPEMSPKKRRSNGIRCNFPLINL